VVYSWLKHDCTTFTVLPHVKTFLTKILSEMKVSNAKTCMWYIIPSITHSCLHIYNIVMDG